MITSHRQARPGKTHANTTLPRHNHPPESKPPSQNSSALQIPNPADNSRPFRPPQTKPPSQSRQNPPSPPNPEGDFSPGGQFRHRRVIPQYPTSSFNQSPNHSTLHRQFHPPNPGKTDEKQALPVNQEGDSIPGGSFRPRRAITSDRQTQPAKTHANTALHVQNHPPNTVPSSTDSSTLPIRAKPTKNRLSRSIGRAFRLLEGDSVAGGRFCTRRVTLSPEGTSAKPHQQF